MAVDVDPPHARTTALRQILTLAMDDYVTETKARISEQDRATAIVNLMTFWREPILSVARAAVEHEFADEENTR